MYLSSKILSVVLCLLLLNNNNYCWSIGRRVRRTFFFFNLVWFEAFEKLVFQYAEKMQTYTVHTYET